MEKNIDFDFVADIYDSYVNVDFDIDFYLKYCAGYQNILELMCGTGRVTLPLINAGCKITCVDYSSGMLDVLQTKVSNSALLRVECQDITTLSLDDQFDLTIIPFNSLSEITDYSKREQALQRINDHLVPEGKLFCTLYNPAYRIKTADGLKKTLGEFELTDDKKLVVSYRNYHDPSKQLVWGEQLYSISQSGEVTENRSMDIRFSLISKEEMYHLAKKSGFVVNKVFGDYEGNSFSEDSMFMNFELIKQ